MSSIKMLMLCLCFLFTIAPQVSGLEFPYVVQVDSLLCDSGERKFSCKNTAGKAQPHPHESALIAETHETGCGYFNKGSGPVNNRWFDQCDPVLTSGYARVCVYDRKNRLGCGLVDVAVKVVVPLVYDDLRLVKGVSVVAVSYMGRWGYYSLESGRLLFAPQFSYASDFSDGMAYAIETTGKSAKSAWFINTQGLRVAAVDRKIRVKGTFSNGLIPARKDSFWGYLDPAGAWAIVPQFLEAGSFAKGIAAVKYVSAPAQWAIIDVTGAGLIFFEGIAHQLAVLKNAEAELTVQCEPESNGSRQTDPEREGEHTTFAANKPCFNLCFTPLTESIGAECDAVSTP